MTQVRDKAVKGRNDLSRFVVHLTRDDRKDFSKGGGTALQNFKSILDDLIIYAQRPRCLHMEKIPKNHHHAFSVCCFMEVPLAELHLVTRPIEGRNNQYSDYGFVFSRDFLISNGAQPAIYVNSYGGNSELKEAADEIYKIAAKSDFHKKLSRLIPYLNIMNERYDFTWEREWRIAGNLEFKLNDIACVILPEQKDEELKNEMLEGGLPVISPGWTMERIVEEFSKQARRARRVWRSGNRTNSSRKRSTRGA